MQFNMKYWIGVACKSHAANGVEQGIAQFCHGKTGPAKRLSKGDGLIYYSSKVTMDGNQKYQKFTAIGIVKDDDTYPFDMGNGFIPFRRNVDYVKSAVHVDIVPLIEQLPFIKNKQAWGSAFRFGFLQIDEISFNVIAAAMLTDNCTPNAENNALQIIRDLMLRNTTSSDENTIEQESLHFTADLASAAASVVTANNKGTLDSFVKITKKRKV